MMIALDFCEGDYKFDSNVYQTVFQFAISLIRIIKTPIFSRHIVEDSISLSIIEGTI